MAVRTPMERAVGLGAAADAPAALAAHLRTGSEGLPADPAVRAALADVAGAVDVAAATLPGPAEALDGGTSTGPPTRLGGPYGGRERGALSDPATVRRGPFPPEAVERMLREPGATRTTSGSIALRQPALLRTELQKVEGLAR